MVTSETISIEVLLLLTISTIITLITPPFTLIFQRKHKIAVEVTWDIPGAYAGNVLPKYNDNGGSFSRRLFVIPFNHAITKSDPDLFRRCEMELGAFLAKCVACYHHVTAKHAKQGLWDKGVLPEIFHEARRNVQKLSNTALAFMTNPNYIQTGEDFVCDEVDILNKYSVYYRSLNAPSGQMSLFEPNNLNIYMLHGIELITIADREDMSHTYIVDGAVITFTTGRYFKGCRPTAV